MSTGRSALSPPFPVSESQRFRKVNFFAPSPLNPGPAEICLSFPRPLLAPELCPWRGKARASHGQTESSWVTPSPSGEGPNTVTGPQGSAPPACLAMFMLPILTTMLGPSHLRHLLFSKHQPIVHFSVFFPTGRILSQSLIPPSFSYLVPLFRRQLRDTFQGASWALSGGTRYLSSVCPVLVTTWSYYLSVICCPVDSELCPCGLAQC